MITTHMDGIFGRRVTILQTRYFSCLVRTTGFLKKQTTVVGEGHRVLMKIPHKPSWTKTERRAMHDAVVAFLDQAGETSPIFVALDDLLYFLKDRNAAGERIRPAEPRPSKHTGGPLAQATDPMIRPDAGAGVDAVEPRTEPAEIPGPPTPGNGPVPQAPDAVIRWEPSDGIQVEGLDERHCLALPKGAPVTIGNGAQCRVVVHGVRIGGRTNFVIRCEEKGAWVLQHAGHALYIRVNSELLSPHGTHLLSAGDCIEPLSSDGSPGPRFIFELAPPGA
jgi:hypothetical protein